MSTISPTIEALALAPGERAAFVGAAARIGERICQEAVWHSGMCNWVGAVTEEGPAGVPTTSYSALGPDLYGGTAGVALFLARLFRFTGEPTVRATAVGAIRQATSRIDNIPPPLRLGLYGGRIGISLASEEVARTLGDEGLALDPAAQVVADDVASSFAEAPEFDLIGGSSGAVVGLLALAAVLDEDRFVEAALHCGEMLLSTARRRPGWYSWGSLASPRARHLCGYSHGAAGAGHALLELYRVTRMERYMDAASKAFGYERHLFDTVAQNWPDLRGQWEGRGRGDVPTTFSTFWCHGAPGISLSRARAFRLTEDPVSRDEAALGLGTTERMIVNALRSSGGNYSLCHGLAGNAEVIVAGRALLGDLDAAEEAGALALQVARRGVEQFDGRARDWPCGTIDGQTPGLFLGLAGIGAFYLRLVAPSLPFLLSVWPEDWGRSLN
jgi:lantibiotic modifying enzyme